MDKSIDTIDTIKKIVIYKGKIKLVSEFSSGALLGAGVTDNPVIRDNDGNAILRGESLAGMIRQELIRLFGNKCEDYTQPDTKEKPCECAVCSLMGHSRIPSKIKENETIKYHSSRLKVSGGIFKDESVRIRHGVAIDRMLNVASAHKKYDYEVLMPDAIAPFKLEIENPSSEEESKIKRLLTEIKYGFLSIGGRKGSGLGAFTLEECKMYSFDMSKKEDVISYLQKGFSEKPGCDKLDSDTDGSMNEFNNALSVKSEKPEENIYRGCRLMIPFEISFPELFLVNDPLEASLTGSDHVSMVDKNGKPYLPPSTIRGVLRSRAEQILRTLNPASACDTTNDRSESSLCSCSAKLVNKKNKNGKDYVPTLNNLEDGTFLCMGCRLFGSTFWGSRLCFQTGRCCDDIKEVETIQHFVAIDRFTGGGKEGAKYDALPLYNIKFSDCRLIIEDFHLWQIGLLALVFKDLLQSDIRMGFGTRKGYGQAVGAIDSEREILLSTPDKIYVCKIKEIYNSNGVNNVIKEILQKAVNKFRYEVQDYKGTNYETV